MAKDSLLVIIEKYDGFVNYIYPVVQNIPRKHGTVKEMMTQSILGYRIAPTYKLIRKDSVIRAKRKVRRYSEKGDSEKLSAFLASWHGHVQTADSHNLKLTIGRLTHG